MGFSHLMCFYQVTGKVDCAFGGIVYYWRGIFDRNINA